MLSESYIIDAIKSAREGSQFPIEFDVAWESSGYSRKEEALRALSRMKGLIRGVHYSANRRNLSTGKTSIYFSVDAYKFFLAKSNTEKGDESLWHLIEIEKRYLAHLERQLSLTALDTPGYPHTADELWKDSGIVSRYQVRDAIKRDFTEGKHWYCENGQIHISEICYKILLLNFRSKRGSSISKLGDRLNIPVAELYEYEQRKRSNTRNPQKYYDPMQMSLFG
jgi:hypothetical protein